MFTPAEAIAALDEALALTGQDVTLRKTNSAAGQVTVKALVRGYRPDEIVGTINQTDKKIILSPTGLATYGMPTGGYVITESGDAPHAIQGKPELIRLKGEVVRIEIRVLG